MNLKINTKLDRTWIDCISLWKWVSKWWLLTGIDVVTLKRWWFWRHPFKRRAGGFQRCFFCHYARVPYTSGCIERCPGKLVDPKFTCIADEYHYRWHPDKFCAELVRLNELRLRKEST